MLSCVPISVPMATAYHEDAAEIPGPPPARKPDRRLVLSDQSIFASMARKMQVLLPRIMEVLQDGDRDIKTKALVVFRNVMGHLKRKEASPFAVQLVEELLPLFDDESSQLRELSISLFRDLVESVVGSNKKRIKNDMWRVLVPLFLRMSDQTDSVAKVQISKLTTDTEKGMLTPHGWPGHQGQGLLAAGSPPPVQPLGRVPADPVREGTEKLGGHFQHLPYLVQQGSAAARGHRGLNTRASGEALLAAAELLKWKELKHLVQTQQTWRIGECLVSTTPKPWAPGLSPRAWAVGSAAVPHLPCSSPQPTAWSCILVPWPQEHSPQGLFSTPLSPPRTLWEGGLSAMRGAGRRVCSGHLGRLCDMPLPLCSLQLERDRSRAEEYLNRSLPYLKDAQATLREAAVRFIGEPQPPGSLFWQPGPTPRRCTGSKEQPCGCQSPPAAPCGALASLSHPCPRRWPCWPPCSVPPPSATALPRAQP
ncbi:hypothetical protein QYF61_017211 [Mycteria americana]|uniref:Maestro/Maestro-like HEAT-repeats domain-containing protein n=1 Tax=Mycteria americana TaxID=33587 RepID=A0AAN7RJC2_MYCAM|nr:hypothetical protein QYF61_017211 [Mycteria americana]